MAIWNFEFYVIPKGAPAPVDTTDGIDCSASWKDAVEPNWGAIVDGCLENAESWSPDIKVWGSQEHIELRVIHADHAVLEAHIRVDVRVNSKQALTTLMRRLESAGLEIVVWPNEPFPPSGQQILNHLKSSAAYQRFHADATE
jgi:hypothetical protein